MIMKPILIALTAALGVSALSACAEGPPPSRVYVQERFVAMPPPPPRQEIIVEAPGPRERFVWDPGHYVWDGAGYRWAPGHWIARREGFVWVPAHWDHAPGGWRFVDGHWR